MRSKQSGAAVGADDVAEELAQETDIRVLGDYGGEGGVIGRTII